MKKKNTSGLEVFLGIMGGIVMLILVIIFVGVTLSDGEPLIHTGNEQAEAEEEETEKPEEEEIAAVTPTDPTVRSQLYQPVGNGEDTVTVMVYMNGSNLESDDGYASMDIQEMIDADDSDQVNVVIQTMGTYEWQDFDIESDHTQRYLVNGNDLELVDDSLDQLSCTSADTLEDFITWSADTYPADRYILVLWDHGGGPVGGFGYDEWAHDDDSLTLDEMQLALKNSGISFDIIGMDACIMSCVEICYSLYDYCDYMVLSEDFESALGWSYEGWLSALADNTSISTVDLGTIIVDDMVADNEDNGATTLALIDERYVPSLFNSWKTFAYENEDSLLSNNYSLEVHRTERAMPSRGATDLQEYFITDMLALTVSISSPLSKPLAAELNKVIVYYNCTEDNAGLSGLSVTLPYCDKSFYNNMKPIFINSGIDKDYTVWLSNFVDVY